MERAVNESEKSFLITLQEFEQAHHERDQEIQKLLHETQEVLSISLDATTQACDALVEQYQEVNKTVGTLKDELANLNAVLNSDTTNDAKTIANKD